MRDPDAFVEEAITEMEASDAIVSPVYDISDIFEDEQYQARNDIVAVEDDDLGTVRTAAPIPFFSRTPGVVDHLGPSLGEHNESVYRDELGLDADVLADLRSRGVI